MSTDWQKTIVFLVGILAMAGGLAFAGSDHGQQIAGISVFVICVLLAFIINWIAFIPSALKQTEKYYDLTGAIANISLPIVAVALSRDIDARGWLLFALVVIWAGRLGLFLFKRIQTKGHDSRFVEIKKSLPRFFIAWSLQALWGCFSLAAALAAITTVEKKALGVVGIVGLLMWIAGMIIEVVADQQKKQFQQNPTNKGKFIQSGLWAWSRHPNYFGEIVLWIGVAIIALPALNGWQWLTMISPLFVIVLLTHISGLPMLEAKADQKWGGQTDYEVYKAKTPILIPRMPARK